MGIETPKIVVFEPDNLVRKYLKTFLENYAFTRDHYAIEVMDEPWSAKDQITPDTGLAMLGHSRGVSEWDALAYLREAPEWLVSIAGSPSWTPEERDEFVRAGAVFTYDRPCSLKKLEVLVKTALKIGPLLKAGDAGKNDVVAVHASGWGENDFLVRHVPK